MDTSSKLIVGFLLIPLFVSIVGFISVNVGQRELQRSIGKNAVALAATTLDKLEETIHHRIEYIQSITQESFVQETLKESNLAFREMEDREQYLLQQDAAWIAAEKEEITPFMEVILENDLSRELRRRSRVLEERYEHGVFGEIFITNKYGANIGQTGKTSDYRQDDEGWWQQGKKEGLHVGEIEYDESADIYSLDISISVDDLEGNFLGVIKAVLNAEELITIIEGIGEEDTSINYQLLTTEGEVIYADHQFQNFEKIPQPYELRQDEPAYTLEQEEKLLALAHSPSLKEFTGLDWVLLLEQEKEKVFAPIGQLRNTILFSSSIITILAAIIGLFLARHIIEPIDELKKAANLIAQGDLNARAKVRNQDEMGRLAADFNHMVDQLNTGKRELKGKVEELERNKDAMSNMVEDLNEALDKAKEADKTKTQFLSVTSHELRTPITPMKAQLQMIMGEYFGSITQEQQKSLTMILNNTERLDHLIADILDISKLESGNMKFDMAEADLNKIATEVVQTMRIKAEQKGIHLELQVEEIPPIVLDKMRVTQVIVNLINNAIKFTDKDGKITIQITDETARARVLVQDTGIGIAKEDAERIFNPFEQVDSSRSRNHEGSGLGLAICQGIVETHGGEISAGGEVGKGSIFQFTIPYKIERKKVEAQLFSKKKERALEKFKRVWGG